MSASDDARRALGVRPGLPPGAANKTVGGPVEARSTQQLVFSEGYKLDDIVPLYPRPSSPVSRAASPTHGEHIGFRDVSLPLPPPISPTDAAPRSPSMGNLQHRLSRVAISRHKPPPAPINVNRGAYETQKLLAHLLDRLEARLVPPDILEQASNQARDSSRKGKGKEKAKVVQLGHAVVAAAQSGLHVGQQSAGAGPSKPLVSEAISSEDVLAESTGADGSWDTEETYLLVDQMRSLLLLASKQKLDILGSNERSPVSPTSPASPTKHKRLAGRFSIASPTSPTRSKFPRPVESSHTALSGTTLRMRVLAVLRTLLANDCLYQIGTFRLLCPPNALQAASLDLASLVYNEGDDEVQVEVMELVSSALETLTETLLERVCSWLQGHLEETLHRLSRRRGAFAQDDLSDPPVESPTIPIFRFTSAQDDTSSQQETTGASKYVPLVGVLSPNQPDAATDPATIRLTRLCVRTLNAVINVMESQSRLSTIYRLHSILRLILHVKADASLDLLEIVAVGSAHARRTAFSLLATYFPLAIGHNIITRRPASLTYLNQKARYEIGSDSVYGEDRTEDHSYIPWRVSSKEAQARSRSNCTICEGEIHGFCIRCTLCNDIQHLQCYSANDGSMHYTIVSEKDSRQITSRITVKFSRLPSDLRSLLDAGLVSRAINASHIQIGSHDFWAVIIFTLTLCSGCKRPLWNRKDRPVACLSGCQGVFHRQCISLAAKTPCQPHRSRPISDLQISLANLRSSFDDNLSTLCVDPTKISYDEVAIIYGELWTAYQTLKNGFSAGTIRLGVSEDLPSDPFGMRSALRRYEEHLAEHLSSASAAVHDFAQIFGLDSPLGPGYLFGDRFLVYLTALLKAPKQAALQQPDFLHLSTLPPGLPAAGEAEETHAPVYQSLSKDSVRRTLEDDLGIRSEEVSGILLCHLETAGLIRMSNEPNSWVHFDLPLLIDSSADVEILLLAMEALLETLDLGMNEQALSLLTNRAWPSLLCSPYALERIGSALIKWIVAEDVVIHRLVREYATKSRRLPGLRAAPDHMASRTSGPVQLYQEARNGLLRHYAQPWLAALHEQDPELYTSILHQQCRASLEDDPSPGSDLPSGSNVASLALDRLVTIVEAGVVFSCLLELLTGWLEDLGALADQDNVFKSLPRLIARHHAPFANDASSPTAIFTFAAETASQDLDGLKRACRWLRVLAYSGVEIPWDVMRHLIDLERAAMCEPQVRIDLVIASNANTARIDTKAFADLTGRMLVGFLAELDSALAVQVLTPIESDLLDRILLLVLKSHGVNTEDFAGTSFHSHTTAKTPTGSLPKQRRSTMFMSSMTVSLDPEVVLAVARLLELRVTSPEKLLDVVWLLSARAKLVENADAVLHSVAEPLSEVIWPTLDLRIDRRCRARLILRLIAIHPEMLEKRIQAEMSGSHRAVAVERSLRFLLDVTDSTVTSDTDGWRARATAFLLSFFSSLIHPAYSEPSSLSLLAGLMPPHFRAASICFEEYLIISSDEKRLELLARLQYLRLRLPRWAVISWSILDQVITEETATVRQLATSKVTQQHLALIDSQLVRCNLIALGLDMLAHDVSIAWATAQRFQQHVAAICALPWDQPVEGITSLILPALRSVLDSPRRIAQQDGNMKNKKHILVGSLLVPVVIDFATVLPQQDIMTQRSLLDIYLVLYFKHDVAPVELSALRALQSIAEYIERTDCADNRSLALRIIQTAVESMDRDILLRVIPFIYHSISKVLVKTLNEDERDGGVIEPCRHLLRRSIKMFGRASLLLNIFRVDGMNHKESVTESIPAKTILDLYPADPSGANAVNVGKIVTLIVTELPEVFKRGRATMEHVLEALSRGMPLLSEHVTTEAVDSFGVFLNRLCKHVADWSASEFDPTSSLTICAQLLDVVTQEQAVGLLSQCGTFLHLSLSRFSVTSSTLTHILFLIAPPMSRRESFSLSNRTLHSRVLREAASSSLTVLLRHHAALLSPRIDPTQVLDIFAKSASIILHSELHNPGTLGASLVLITSEAVLPQIGVFTSMLFACLEPAVEKARGSVVALYPVLARATAVGLRSVADALTMQDEQGRGAEMLSAIFVVIRLAIYVVEMRSAAGTRTTAQSGSGGSGGKSWVGENGKIGDGEAAIMATGSGTRGGELEVFWSRIWPDWYRLLSLSLDPTCTNAPLRSVVHSVYYDLIIFLGRLHSPLLVAHSSALSGALDILVTANGERASGGASSGGGKLGRAAAALEHAGLEEGTVDRSKLIEDIREDLLAMERLKALRVPAPEVDRNLYMVVR